MRICNFVMDEESSGIDVLGSKRKFVRGCRGRFVSSSPLNVKKTKRAEQQRKHKERRNETKNELFNEYLSCIVLQGKANDSITASRSKGPFAQLFEAIVRIEYRLGPNLRHAGLKLFYTERGYIRSANGIAPKLTMKPNEYKGCRLPRPSLGYEMNAVRKWIIMVWNEKALLPPSVNEAFQLCRNLFRIYTACESGRNAASLPLLQNMPQQNEEAQLQISDSSNTRIVDESSIGSTQVDHTTAESSQMNARPEPRTRVHGASAACSTMEISSPRISDLTQRAQEDLRQSKRLNVCLEIARNEQMYMILHLALDDSSESQFGAYSGTYLKDMCKQGEEPCELVKMISMYAHWKRYGIPNRFQYDQLERRLKNTAAICDRVRVLTSTEDKPLPLYEDMRWDFMK